MSRGGRARVRRRHAGLTLVEVLVALLVATVGLLGALAMLGTLLRGSDFSRSASEAGALAQAKLEDLRAMTGITIAPPNPPDGTTTETVDAFGRVATSGRVYTRSWTWSTVADVVGARRHLEVQVTWNDGDGRPHSVVATGERMP